MAAARPKALTAQPGAPVDEDLPYLREACGVATPNSLATAGVDASIGGVVRPYRLGRSLLHGAGMAKWSVVQAQLADCRSHHVIAVSHCLLNENARYQGGAFRPGVVTEVIRTADRLDAGIYQMPCPEQRAWGGVTRRYTLPIYDSAGTLRYRLRNPLTALLMLRSRFVYWRLAGTVARDLADFLRAGTQVDAIVGVRGSPTCGVCRTLHIPAMVKSVGNCHLGSTNTRRFAEEVIVNGEVAGKGMFFRALDRQLRRRKLSPALVEHDFVAEMQGRRTPLPLESAFTPLGTARIGNR